MSSGMEPALEIAAQVATITLRRPDQANRLGPEDLQALAAHIAEVNGRGDVVVLRIVAMGKYFCSGYDVGKLGTPRPVSFDEMADALEQARPVTIAALQGGVYGGATDMALACDFRIGVTDGDMFMPAARLGLHFYASGMKRYVSRMSMNAALRLFLTAEKIDAKEMKALGYLTHLVSPDELAATVDDLTARLLEMAPIALLGMKKHLGRIARGELDHDDLGMDIARALASADIAEGRAAWSQKRKPRFTGK